MPFVVINLGAEMVFILDQRLRAQNVGKEKSQKVLQEILKFMFNKSFLEELFKPQDRHSYNATKHLFTKLAHSSVMKLNENSMSKLFDLMVMGVKFQIVSTTIPEELYHLTLRHLQEVEDLVTTTSAVEYVEECRNWFINMCKGFTAYDFQMIKQLLLSFFQEKHVKVSLFIQEKIQSLDGTLNIFYTGIGPIFSQKPGTITYYDADGKVRDTDEVTLNSNENYEPNPFSKRLEGATDGNLGLNMYAEERKPLCSRPKPQDDGPINKSQKPTMKKKVKEDKKEEEKDLSTQEYSFIKSMIRGAGDEKEKIPITFDSTAKAAKGSSGEDVDQNIIEIDTGKDNLKKKETMMKDFDDMDLNPPAEADDGDDLLDLMDS